MSSNKQNLILVVSDNMNTNKKSDRNEHDLVRMSAGARNSFALANSKIEISYKTQSSLLNVHEAFSSDIKQLKKDGFSIEDLKRVGFVTKDTFQKLTNYKGGMVKNNVFIGKPEKPKKAPFEMLIGADPEFLLFDNNGNVVRANNILPKPGPIGSDGAMIEIRPNPTPCPSQLVNNMKEIFANEELTAIIKNYEWKAAIYHKDDQRDYPVGGHIHLGNPPGMDKFISGNSKSYLFAVFNKIMDELLAIPLIKLDGSDLGKSRRSDCKMAMGNNGYGFYGEWRPCDGRLEHRTLSGLWLMHPVIADCVLGAAKAIAEEMYGMAYEEDFASKLYRHPDITLGNHKRLYRSEFDDWSSITLTAAMDCTKSSSFMASTLNTSKTKSITKAYLKGWYAQMKRLSTYRKYSKQIDKLYAILCLPRKNITDVGFDLKKNWLEENGFSI